MLPTLAIIKHEKTTDYVVGLDELGGEDFATGAPAVRCCCTGTPHPCCWPAAAAAGAAGRGGEGAGGGAAVLGEAKSAGRLLPLLRPLQVQLGAESKAWRASQPCLLPPLPPAETLAARLAAAGAIFEDALPAPKQAAAEVQQRTMRQGGHMKRSESDEDSDFE